MIPLNKKKDALPVCHACSYGRCCRQGVEVDLFEVAQILKRRLDIPKPWFKYLRRDRSFPSGFKFTTLLRNRRCIFQDERNRCHIYDIRPRFCQEFPLEGGRKAPYYHRLCHHARKNRRQKAEVRSRNNKRTNKS